MTAAADLATVVALALLVDDRTAAEQTALQRCADRLDRERNRNTATNRRHDHNAPKVPCTAPWHTDTDTCRTCSMQSDPCCRLLIPPFTVAATAEPLTDGNGWSVAGHAVQLALDLEQTAT